MYKTPSQLPELPSPSGIQERRLWVTKNVRLPYCFNSMFNPATSTAVARHDRRSPPSTNSCRLRCDRGEAVCASPALLAARLDRSGGCSNSGLDSGHTLLRPGALPRVNVAAACPPGPGRARSESGIHRRKTCNRWRSRDLRHETRSRPDPVAASARDVGWETRDKIRDRRTNTGFRCLSLVDLR